MKISFVTLFLDVCRQMMLTGVLGRGIEKGIIGLEIVNIRDFAANRYGTVDDLPYGGGPGMVLKVEPVVKAVESIAIKGRGKRILLSPVGKTFNQKKAKELSSFEHLVFICGRYEGVDERVGQCLQLEDSSYEVLSLGDFVLTGGELAALAMADAVCRLVEGVLGKSESICEESFSTLDGQGGLEYPHYTRPRTFRGISVPEVLLSGHHEQIKKWRQIQSQNMTRERRPDLFALAESSVSLN